MIIGYATFNTKFRKNIREEIIDEKNRRNCLKKITQVLIRFGMF